MKISVIMQSYLGDYPGSRSHPRQKFVRAVNSFLAQTHPDKELIIVSDGCPFTPVLYELVFRSFPEIHLVVVDQPPPAQRMYDKTGEQKTFFRGYPKAVGLKHATGDLVVYLDTDDLILPTHLASLNCIWSNADKAVKWGSNILRVMHTKLLDLQNGEPKQVYSKELVDLTAYGITDSFFINLGSPFNLINSATYNLSHRRDIAVTWEDAEGVNEDMRFMKQLQATHGRGLRVYTPTMVICHYRNVWDV